MELLLKQVRNRITLSVVGLEPFQGYYFILPQVRLDLATPTRIADARGEGSVTFVISSGRRLEFGAGEVGDDPIFAHYTPNLTWKSKTRGTPFARRGRR